MSKHYTLTPFQYDALKEATKTEGNVFLVPLPLYRDCKFLEKELYSRAAAIDELRCLGLMKNVCKKYLKLLSQQKRGFIAYALTDTGRLMFSNAVSRAIN